MTTDRLLERLRAADPDPVETDAAHSDLFTQIVARPGDARLVASCPARGPGHHRQFQRWLRLGRRPLLLASALVIVTGAAAATTGILSLGQFLRVTPRRLFIANPEHLFPHTPNQTVILRTISRAATFTVPGAGRFEFWIARSQKGWLCEAIRQPDHTWADLPNPDDRYQFGGPVPGCEGAPWQDTHGFSYNNTTMATRQGGWRIVYGYAPVNGRPVSIRDRLSGATAAIGDGRYFAMVMRLCHGAGCMRRLVFPTHYFQLETLSTAGQVLARNDIDHGN